MTPKQIAAQILADWENCRYVHKEPQVGTYQFKIDGMTLSCRDSHDAVCAMSEKFRKARSHPNPIPKARSLKRAFATTIKDFKADGEHANAVEYAKLNNRGEK